MTLTAWDRLRAAWREAPYPFTFATVLIPVGALAMVLGAEVSQALTNITAEFVCRVMGLLMCSGGILTYWGLLSRRALIEFVGMWFTVLGTNVYGMGVLAGLGLQGAVAGPGYLAIAAASGQRMLFLFRRLRDERPGGCREDIKGIGSGG